MLILVLDGVSQERFSRGDLFCVESFLQLCLGQHMHGIESDACVRHIIPLNSCDHQQTLGVVEHEQTYDARRDRHAHPGKAR
jgi:hypothetical protein